MPELTTHLFTIGVAGQSRTAILLCAGRMDAGTTQALRGALAAAIGTEVPVVEVDLRKVSLFDRSAAAALVQAHHELARQGRELRLVVNSGTHARLRRLGTDAALNIRASGEADPTRLPGGEANEARARRGREGPPEREET